MTAINVAISKTGAPFSYEWGGTGPYGFDCSGLVQTAFSAAGKALPRTAGQQYAAAPTHVPISQVQPGDLVFWGGSPNFSHVAIYIGNGQVVHALNPSQGILVNQLSAMSAMGLHPVAARY